MDEPTIDQLRDIVDVLLRRHGNVQIAISYGAPADQVFRDLDLIRYAALRARETSGCEVFIFRSLCQCHGLLCRVTISPTPCDSPPHPDFVP